MGLLEQSIKLPVTAPKRVPILFAEEDYLDYHAEPIHHVHLDLRVTDFSPTTQTKTRGTLRHLEMKM